MVAFIQDQIANLKMVAGLSLIRRSCFVTRSWIKEPFGIFALASFCTDNTDGMQSSRLKIFDRQLKRKQVFDITAQCFFFFLVSMLVESTQIYMEISLLSMEFNSTITIKHLLCLLAVLASGFAYDRNCFYMIIV